MTKAELVSKISVNLGLEKNEVLATIENFMEEVKNSDPDVIILMPCGFDTDRTVSEYDSILSNNSAWNSLKAVKDNQIYAVDANSFFSKPSIRTIDGLEILAKIIHPDKFKNLIVPTNSFAKLS